MTSSVTPGLFAFWRAVANEAKATRQEPGDDEDGVHRLRDIVVEEVSLVDRAANKRRFLVVKRSGDMPDDGQHGTEVKPEDKGAATETRVEKAKKKPKVPPDAETEKARRRAAPTDGDDDETEKARAKDDEEDAEKARSRSRAADDEEEDAEKARGDDEEDDDEVEKAGSKKKPTVGGRPEANEEFQEGATEKADDDEEDDDDDFVLPSAVKNAVLGVLAQSLERLMAVANRVKEADEPDDETEPSVPDDVGEELEAIGELLEDVGERFDGATEKRGVKKAGARMAKDRLDRFQKALALLSEVLKELTDAKKPMEPTAGAAEDKVEKRDAAPGMRDLVASIGELTRVVKRQEDELARIRQTRGVSNAIPVDGGGRRAEAQEVSWPLDMNRPISRDSVAKAVSFYEE
jgi:hypothetical protein